MVTNCAAGGSVSVTLEGVRAALAQVEGYLLKAPVLEALIARREAGCIESDDDDTAAELAGELVSYQAADGSWGEQTVATAEALLLLGALLPDAPPGAGTRRGAAWLRGRQNRPGSFGSDCQAELHTAGLCGHAVSGFFSPAAPQVALTGATLANGIRFATDRDARVGISSLALRACMRWEPLSTDDRLHLDGLRRIADQSFRPGRPGLIGAAAALESMATLAAAPRSPELMASLHGAVTRLATTQRADGSFGDLSTFPVLDVLLSVIRAGYMSPAFDAAIERAVEMLTFMQQRNGLWGNDVNPQCTLIGWRALRHATRMMGGH